MVIPSGPMTRAEAKKINEALNGVILEFQALQDVNEPKDMRMSQSRNQVAFNCIQIQDERKIGMDSAQML